jgi:hypothetical protein
MDKKLGDYATLQAKICALFKEREKIDWIFNDNQGQI